MESFFPFEFWIVGVFRIELFEKFDQVIVRFADHILHGQGGLLGLLQFVVLDTSLECEHFLLEGLEFDEGEEGLHDVLVDALVLRQVALKALEESFDFWLRELFLQFGLDDLL